MRKPPTRQDIPPRKQDNNKRRLKKDVEPAEVADLRRKVVYGGSSKHKRNPTIYGLEPFNGERGDSTLCDEHAKFQLEDMVKIPELIERGLKAELLGMQNLLWTVADDGWIFEGRRTNAVQSEYHGYPVRPSEAIAEPVYRKFRAWAESNGNATDKNAAANCAALYRFKDA